MQIKVLCLNMWLGGKLFENMKDFVAQENPDIIALQEVHQAREIPAEEAWHDVGDLARILRYEQYIFASGCGTTTEQGHNVYFGNAILSRFPLRSAGTIFYDIPYNDSYIRTPGDYRDEPRNLQHGVISVGETLLHIYNTQGIWGFDGEDNERRLAMADVIAREVDGKAPALLMGDFNVLESTGAIATIEKHMQNIFKGELTTSFNMRHKNGGGFGSAAVDMIFASPDVQIIEHHTSSADVSDHVPLLVEIEIL